MENSIKSMLNRRASLLNKHIMDVPAQHETFSNLGNSLGKTVLSSMCPKSKDLMSVEAPCKIAPKTLWISPSDRVAAQIMLRPPPNEAVIKALTHEGILQIGLKFINDLEKQCQSRIEAAKKEVEVFERFECDNRVRFALENRQSIINQKGSQNIDLVDIYRKEYENMIEANTKNVESNKKGSPTTTEKEQSECFENEKIKQLMEEIKTGKEKLTNEVETRKQKDWKILQEIFTELNKQFNQKIKMLEKKHKVEIRQILNKNEVETIGTETEKSIDVDPASDVELEGNQPCERTSVVEFNEHKPFIKNLCAVEGEDPEEVQSHKLCVNSTGSSLKCYKNDSKNQTYSETSIVSEQQLIQFGSHESYFYSNTQCNTVPNTTDISCNILRQLDIPLNIENIEKVKRELDAHLFNYLSKTNMTASKLLETTDSKELIAESIPPAVCEDESTTLGAKESRESMAETSIKKSDIDVNQFVKRFSKVKSEKFMDTKKAIPLTVDEYVESLKTIPPYMRCNSAKISLWDYRTMNDQEWDELLTELETKEEIKTYDRIMSRSKTVTVNSSAETVTVRKSTNSQSGKPVKGILRSSLENKSNSEHMLENEVFQTKEVQSLVNELKN